MSCFMPGCEPQWKPPTGRKLAGWVLAGVVAFVLMSLALGCAVALPPVEPPTIPDGAAPATCADACYHLDAELGCQNGGACLGVCRDLRGPQGQRFKDCLLAATSCEQVDVCDR